MSYQLREKIPGHAVDKHLYFLWPNPVEDDYRGEIWRIWSAISEKSRPPIKLDDGVMVDIEDSEFGSAWQILGGGGMAATQVDDYFINPSLDLETERTRLEKLVEQLRAQRWRQMDIMDRAMHDPEYRERRAFLERREEVGQAWTKANEITSLIRTVAIYSPSQRSGLILKRAQVFIKSNHDIKFPLMPEQPES